MHLQGAYSCNSVPTQWTGFPAFKSISIGTYTTCGITTSDDAFCWGIGPLNYGNTSGAPAVVPGGIKFATLDVEEGFGLNNGSEVEHVCGIDKTRNLYCWKRGGSPTSPAQMSGSNYVAVSLGGVSLNTGADQYRGCALDVDGIAYCWGTNALGDGNPSSTTDRTTPVAIGGALRFSAIATDSYFTCGIATNGGTYCWGGAGVQILVPTLIDNSLHFTTIDGGWAGFCGIASDQTAYCWDFNGTGAALPVQVPGSYHFRSISVGGPESCGITLEGPEVCWGSRSYGALGDGVVNSGSTPNPTPIAGQRVWP